MISLFYGLKLVKREKDNNIIIPREWWTNFREKKVIVGIFPEQCIFVFPFSKWLQIRVGDKDCLIDKKLRKDIRIIFSSIKEKELSEDFFYLPDYPDFNIIFSKEILLVGCGDYFEIWRKNNFKKELQENIRRIANKDFLE